MPTKVKGGGSPFPVAKGSSNARTLVRQSAMLMAPSRKVKHTPIFVDRRMRCPRKRTNGRRKTGG